MRAILAVALAALLGSGPAAGANAWRTQEQVDASARELVERMTSVGFEPNKPAEEMLAGARAMIEAMRDDLEERGEAGMAELAPVFDGVKLPPSGDERLDRMGAYNLCFVALSIEVRNPSLMDDVANAFATTLGVSAAALASTYSRHLYLESGGDAGALPAYTADEGRKAVFNGLFRDAALRATVLEGCRPVVRALVGRPLQRMIEEALFE